MVGQSNGMSVRRSMTIDADAVFFGLLRRQQRTLHERAPGEDDDVRRPRAGPRTCRTAPCSSAPGYSPLL